MIKRDYFIRLVQELMQSLQRAEFLKERRDYDAGLREIDQTLARFWEVTPEQAGQLTLEDWIGLCTEEETGRGEKLAALGDLFSLRGELFELKNDPERRQQSYALALGLYLETLRTSRVSVDLIQKTHTLIEQTAGAPRPAAVLERLLYYFEARGQFALAEDVLFDWLGTGQPQAKQGGLAFYDRLLAKPDEELEAGALPRSEVEQGRRELLEQRQA